MRNASLLSLAVLATGFTASELTAQANTVAGLDGRLTRIDNLTYYGRRGSAYPNGEIGMAMLNTMCNPGSVNIPWYQAMNPDHPMFGFLIVRVHNDKIEQINEWSYCKHAFLSINVNGACGTCQNPGTGSLMGLNCADTYAPSNNASRTWLGPPEEIDPWLGVWEPVGSYFDIGDPAQAGYPAAADGSRSLSQSIFDSVDNRVTVDEVDLTTAGASYYYGLQLIHEGEALANRDDNLAHRGFNPVYGGSTWSFNNNAEAQAYGSILDRWPGATVNGESNGLDDGRFYVASKVASLGGGNYHYEYAVHNVDNSRAGSSFRIPVPAGVTASNFTFGDIDTDGANDWSAAQVGNEVVFTATASNPLEWNTIYNFGFDADLAPGVGGVYVDEARPGAGAPFVQIDGIEVPGGVILASFDTFGAGCEGSVATGTAPCVSLNENGGTLSGNTNQYEYCFRVTNTGSMDVTSFDIYTGASGSSITRQAHIYAANGSSPAVTPLASTTITVDPAEGFYTATFASPITVTGTFYIGYENSPGGIISNLSGGASGVGFYRTGTNNWQQSGLVDNPSWRVYCTTSTPTYATAKMGNTGLPQLGSSYSPTVSDALASTFAILVSGTSDQVYQGLPLPLPLPGAAGCDLLVSAEVLDLVITDAQGSAQSSISVPNNPSIEGVQVFHQWAIWDPTVNSLGMVVSDAGRATVGN